MFPGANIPKKALINYFIIIPAHAGMTKTVFAYNDSA